MEMNEYLITKPIQQGVRGRYFTKWNETVSDISGCDSFMWLWSEILTLLYAKHLRWYRNTYCVMSKWNHPTIRQTEMGNSITKNNPKFLSHISLLCTGNASVTMTHTHTCLFPHVRESRFHRSREVKVVISNRREWRAWLLTVSLHTSTPLSRKLKWKFKPSAQSRAPLTCACMIYGSVIIFHQRIICLPSFNYFLL